MMKALGLTLAVGVAAFALPPAEGLRADTLITLREGMTMAAPGAPAPPAGEGKRVELWIASDRMARVDDAQRMVSCLDENRTYLISEAAGTCRVIAHGRPHPGAADGTQRFEATGETRRIGPWQAEGYLLTQALGDDRLEVRVWISDEVAVDSTAARRQIEGIVTPATAWMLDMMALDGYPVRQESSIGPVRTWSEVVAIEDAEPSTGTYQAPAGCEPLDSAWYDARGSRRG